MPERDLRTEALAEKVKRELKTLRIPVAEELGEITINSRTRKRLGACYRKRKPCGEWQYTIGVSKRALAFSDEALCSILAHELLHTCPGCFDHGKKWKYYGRKVTSELGYTIQRTADFSGADGTDGTDAAPGANDAGAAQGAANAFGAPNSAGNPYRPYEEAVKYVVTCPSCGQRYERRRLCPLVKNPQRYRCGRCGARLRRAVQIRP